MISDKSIFNILDRVNLVVFQTRIVTPLRDTGEGKKDGSRIEKVLQSCFNPSTLRPLTRKKQEATRICRNFGTKVETLNAWAVPVDRAPELLEQLSRIANDWNGLADELAKSMSSYVTAWANQNPSESEMIRELAPSDKEVKESTRFIYTSFRLRADDVDDNGCLEGDISGLAGQTLHEFSVMLRDASLDKVSGIRYTQGVKEVFARLAKKAESLSFLDPIIAEVASVLTNTIAMLPQNGLILNAHAVLVRSIIDQMLATRTLMKNGFSKFEQIVERPVAKKEDIKAVNKFSSTSSRAFAW